MSPRALSSLDDWQESSSVSVDAAPAVRAPHTALASLASGMSAAVMRVVLDGELVCWLEAIGIGAGDRVTVLRRGAFGGPIHLRTQAGGEFAVDCEVAAAIHVEADGAAEPR